ncbi:Thioredoxin-like protein AAED1, chloroplastic [Gracilariopsis chorda]|uniref:Thioredoxin-like protein AAED1, chloroplastic n=1 Tax=Gracilariopsis chorda TaxID=448386 RepID=A0A2V3IU68_9FLOR|nr:Thioredoxin-like protein AAED1, chloroplastic [Gracilariopsis chorda]|eukprot:PXF45653.1 Thioredoxin-like protein AAED1, chloroplastic [Gracilariopsis chorda]
MNPFPPIITEATAGNRARCRRYQSESYATQMTQQTTFLPQFFPRLQSRSPRRQLSTRRKPRASALPATQTAFRSLFADSQQSTVLTPQNVQICLIDHVSSHNASGHAVLLGWLRHFGCTLCKKQASDWKSILPQLRQHGPINVALVGCGTPAQARDFREEIGWTDHLFTDPDRRTYKALGFKAGLLTTFNLPALGKMVNSFREGNPQTWSRIPKDPFQQGGTILIDKHGVVRMCHAEHFAGDHLAKERLIAEVSKLTTE